MCFFSGGVGGKQGHWPNDNVKFPKSKVLTTTRTHNSKSFFLYIYFNGCSTSWFAACSVKNKGRSNNHKIVTISQMFISNDVFFAVIELPNTTPLLRHHFTASSFKLARLYGNSLNNIEQNQFFRASKNEHRNKLLFERKQPGSNLVVVIAYCSPPPPCSETTQEPISFRLIRAAR